MAMLELMGQVNQVQMLLTPLHCGSGKPSIHLQSHHSRLALAVCSQILPLIDPNHIHLCIHQEATDKLLLPQRRPRPRRQNGEETGFKTRAEAIQRFCCRRESLRP
jgi:hypothetical protein